MAVVTKPLPPYGAEYLKRHPDTGIVVAFGGDAWQFARRATSPVLVLPEDRCPESFRWPGNGNPALIHERGCPNDDRLNALARELLLAGAPAVVALRHRHSGDDNRVFFYPESQSVAA